MGRNFLALSLVFMAVSFAFGFATALLYVRLVN